MVVKSGSFQLGKQLWRENISINFGLLRHPTKTTTTKTTTVTSTNRINHDARLGSRQENLFNELYNRSPKDGVCVVGMVHDHLSTYAFDPRRHNLSLNHFLESPGVGGREEEASGRQPTRGVWCPSVNQMSFNFFKYVFE